jgi:hypothetical protein
MLYQLSYGIVLTFFVNEAAKISVFFNLANLSEKINAKKNIGYSL